MGEKNVKKTIKEAEKNPYFTGQISFLLYLADLLEGNIDNGKIKVLEAYRVILDLIFDKRGLGVDGVLWRRAILSCANSVENSSKRNNEKVCYPCEHGGYYSFVNDTRYDGSWKYFLRIKNIEIKEKVSPFQELIKDVLQEINENKCNTRKSIESFLVDKVDKYLCNCNVTKTKELLDPKKTWYWFLNEDGILKRDEYISHSEWRITAEKNEDGNLKPTYVLMGENFRSFYYSWNTLWLGFVLKKTCGDNHIVIYPKGRKGNNCRISLRSKGQEKKELAEITENGASNGFELKCPGEDKKPYKMDQLENLIEETKTLCAGPENRTAES